MHFNKRRSGLEPCSDEPLSGVASSKLVRARKEAFEARLEAAGGDWNDPSVWNPLSRPEIDPGASTGQESASGDTAGGLRAGPEARRAAEALEALPLSIQEPKLVHHQGQGLTAEKADRLVSRLGRYSKAVGTSVELVEVLRRESGQVGSVPFDLRAEHLADCGSWLEFRHFFTHPDQPVKLAAGDFCQQHLLCGLCSIRRAAKSLRAYMPKILTAIQPGMGAFLGTFTVPNSVDLAAQFRLVESSIRSLSQLGRNTRNGKRGRSSAFSSVIGAVFSFEAKRGEGTRGGGWHLHVHALLLTDSPQINSDGIIREWCESTGGVAHPGAQLITPVHSMMHLDSEDLAERDLVESIGGDLLEVFKYPLKFSTLAPVDRIQAFRSLFGRRLIRGMGILRGIVVDPSYLDDPMEVEDLPYIRLLFRHAAGGYLPDGRFFVDKPSNPC